MTLCAWLLFYVTPIVYTIDKLGFAEGSWQLRLIKLNPLVGIVGMFRAAILWGGPQFHSMWDMKLMYYSAAVAVLSVIVGFLMFYKYQDKFILHI